MDKLIKKSSGKLIIIMLVALTFVIVVFCYRLLINQGTISSIAYSSLKRKDDYRVYIKEDGKYVPFLVIDNGYEKGSTLLLREEILAETKRMNEYSSYYKDSEIDRFLNGSYYENLKEIHSLIESTACTLSEYLSQSRVKMRLQRRERDKTGKAEITRDRANLTETILRVCDSNNEKNGQNFISVFEVVENKRIID